MKPLEEITVSINVTKFESRLIWIMTVVGSFMAGVYVTVAYIASEVVGK
jgi:hypothetical protein